jgi:hypothetical protein
MGDGFNNYENAYEDDHGFCEEGMVSVGYDFCDHLAGGSLRSALK